MSAIEDVLDEQARQILKWGVQDHPDEWYFTILMEEVGETSKAMLEYHFQYPGCDAKLTRHELVQAVAVGLSWLDAIDRRG